MAPKPGDGTGRYLTGSELARAAGVTRQAVAKQSRKGKLPRRDDGLYDREDPVVRAYITNPRGA